MPEKLKTLQELVLEEAASWRGTPYHDKARVKGAGVDCGQFLIAIAVPLGLMEDIPIKYFTAGPGYYSRDFMLHRDEPWYLEIVEKFCRPVEKPLPADVVLYKMGRLFSHGAWIVDWPRIIHAMGPRVEYADGTQGRLMGHEHRFYRPLAYENQ